ncbi:MAG: hypothetical protein CM1200mP3_15960 [Chloroflexota bacterium]|nr:MAG: hypothetical protein CM1200mP3_15960 [Chloroflexota bacterium]
MRIQIQDEEDKKGLSVASRAEELGDNFGEIDGTIEGEIDEESRIAFNNKYLSEVLMFLETGKLLLK